MADPCWLGVNICLSYYETNARQSQPGLVLIGKHTRKDECHVMNFWSSINLWKLALVYTAWDNAKVSIISKPKFGMAKKYLLGQVFRNDKDLQSSFMNHNTLYHFLFNSKLGWQPPSWVFFFLNQQFMLTLLSEILRHHIKPCRIQRSCEF